MEVNFVGFFHCTVSNISPVLHIVIAILWITGFISLIFTFKCIMKPANEEILLYKRTLFPRKAPTCLNLQGNTCYFCVSEETTSRVEKQPMGREKILANHMSH